MMTAPMQPQPLIRLRNVTRSYPIGGQDLRVLDGIDLCINPGEFVGDEPTGNLDSKTSILSDTRQTPERAAERPAAVKVA